MASTHTHATKPESERESEASNIEIETCFSECGDHINDENLQLFEDVFLTSRHDERKSLPSLPPTKKIFLQLLFLKTTHQKSWEALSTWMTTLFPSYPASKCRNLVEKIKKEARSLITTPAKFAEFLDQEVDIYFLGPRCQADGITRRSFDDPHIPHERRVTRGILLELASAFGQTQQLFSTINHLYPNKYTKKYITCQFKATKQKHVKYSKNKSRSDADSKYLEEEIEFTCEQTERAIISNPSITEPAQSCKRVFTEKDTHQKGRENEQKNDK